MVMCRKTLLDCGAHLGESVDKFRTILPDINEYKIYMFEPNIFMYDRISIDPKYNDCIKMRCAVSNKNCSGKLYGCTNYKENSGATIEKFKVECDNMDREDCIDTEIINLSEFIKGNFSIDDKIILKLDIEGSEYDVLESLIKDGTITYISKLYCEFHTKWFKEEFKIREENITKQLISLGLTPEYWDALNG